MNFCMFLLVAFGGDEVRTTQTTELPSWEANFPRRIAVNFDVPPEKIGAVVTTLDVMAMSIQVVGGEAVRVDVTPLGGDGGGLRSAGSLQLDFSTDIYGFGIQHLGHDALTVRDATGAPLVTSAVTAPGFLGVISNTPFRSATITAADPAGAVVLDKVHWSEVAPAVSEPVRLPEDFGAAVVRRAIVGPNPAAPDRLLIDVEDGEAFFSLVLVADGSCVLLDGRGNVRECPSTAAAQRVARRLFAAVTRDRPQMTPTTLEAAMAPPPAGAGRVLMVSGDEIVSKPEVDGATSALVLRFLSAGTSSAGSP